MAMAMAMATTTALLTTHAGAPRRPPAPLAMSMASRLSFSRSESLTSGVASFSSAASASASIAVVTHSSPLQPAVIYCGRGDKKTAKGKRFKHSFGNARPHDKNKGRGPPRIPTPPLPPAKKDRFDDEEIVKIEIDQSIFSE